MSDTRVRQASHHRTTGETDVEVAFALDGSGACEIDSGVPFLDHMLHLFAVHGRFDLNVKAIGDTHIDDHHTVEDIAIVLGGCLREALGDKRGIRRYGNAFVPMDETLAQVAIDVSNRPHLEYRADYPSRETGRFQTELVHEFLDKLAIEGRLTLHVIVHYGHNTHHMIEAVFKALGRALREATSIEPGRTDVPSSKGLL